MFVGHYAAAFVLKGKEPSASLGMLFIGVQLVDILFFPLPFTESKPWLLKPVIRR